MLQRVFARLAFALTLSSFLALAATPAGACCADELAREAGSCESGGCCDACGGGDGGSCSCSGGGSCHGEHAESSCGCCSSEAGCDCGSAGAPEPSIAILEPAPGAVLSGETTIRIRIENAHGFMVSIYFDMVGRFEAKAGGEDHGEGHDCAGCACHAGEVFEASVEVDTAAFYDGEHTVNVHVHPHQGTRLFFESRIVVTRNSNPAPNGDWKVPTVKVDHHKIKDGRFLDSWVEMCDDASLEGALSTPHVNTAILNPSFGRKFRSKNLAGVLCKKSHLVYRTDILPFQTSAPTEITIVFFITDTVGRANMIPSRVRLPALTADQRALQASLPSAVITNVESFQTSIPARVQVRVTNPGSAARLRLWLGDNRIASIALDGSEAELEIAVNPKTVARILSSTVGDAARANPLWMDFELHGKSIPNFGHVHVNPPAVIEGSSGRGDGGRDSGRRERKRGSSEPRGNIEFKLFVRDAKGVWEDVKLRPEPGEWERMTIELPLGLAYPLKSCGLYITSNKESWAGVVHVDAIDVGGERWSFEDGSMSPWQWKGSQIASVSITDDLASDGAKSLALQLTGKGKDGQIYLRNPASLRAGSVLSLAVQADSSLPLRER